MGHDLADDLDKPCNVPMGYMEESSLLRMQGPIRVVMTKFLLAWQRHFPRLHTPFEKHACLRHESQPNGKLARAVPKTYLFFAPSFEIYFRKEKRLPSLFSYIVLSKLNSAVAAEGICCFSIAKIAKHQSKMWSQ